jgi:hypothetical protein
MERDNSACWCQLVAYLYDCSACAFACSLICDEVVVVCVCLFCLCFCWIDVAWLRCSGALESSILSFKSDRAQIPVQVIGKKQNNMFHLGLEYWVDLVMENFLSKAQKLKACRLM